MAVKSAICCVTVLISIMCVHGGKVSISSALVNKDVQRKVDLTSSLARVISDITLENTGSSNVASFVLAVEPFHSESVSSVVASILSGEDEEELTVEPAEVQGGPAGALFFEVILSKPLSPGKTLTVASKCTYTHVLEPFPAEIKQADKQLVRYSGNLHFYSPYKTVTQKTVVLLASATIESFTKTKPHTKSESTISYGPFEKKDEYSTAELKMHYENNTPFLAVTSMERVIEVSHWGNIAVEETYDVRHTGAKLSGSFSRYDYQRQPNPFSSVKSFKTVLPPTAQDVYYRDEIGNISTSNMRELDDAVEVELRPRFPLFGGWKTHYVIGYSVPSYQYLWTDGGSGYTLKMPFLDHVFDNQVVDEIVVKIILPEGSKVQDLSAPFEYQRGRDDVKATYLDTVGRPVIVMSKKNLVDDHIKDFKLSYTFNKLMLFREPFLVVGFFYLIFLTAIIYVRMDFSISRDEAAESKMKVSSYVDQAQNLLDSRTALYQAYKDAVDKYKSSKDMSAYSAQKKKLDAAHKEITGELIAAQGDLKSEGADQSAEKIAEIQKLDAAIKESLAASSALAEKLVNSKLNKDAYVTQEEQAANKRSEMQAKIDAMSNQL